ncbi:MAG: GTPase ObgE [Desulfococcaceae bacterium]
MKFVDEATITVRSGNGGNGCLSFRRERFIPKGGPDGGDGGRGGDVRVAASPRIRTLYDFRSRRQFRAPNGRPGEGGQRTGRGGDDLVVEVPLGTLVYDADDGTPLADLTGPEDSVVVARGGRGGRGNLHFKSSTHRTPRFAQPGEPGETRNLRLELKLLADVGIVGFPNAGKSTLIGALSAARPRIADYPFTTVAPNLGVVTDGGDPFVVADVPGLIEGAHAGAGLGVRFLRHLERTRLLVHLIDAAEIDPDAPLERYGAIQRELSRYSVDLGDRPQVVVFSKMDIPEAEVGSELFEMAAREIGLSVHPLRISAATRSGLRRLVGEIRRRLDSSD